MECLSEVHFLISYFWVTLRNKPTYSSNWTRLPATNDRLYHAHHELLIEIVSGSPGPPNFNYRSMLARWRKWSLVICYYYFCHWYFVWYIYYSVLTGIAQIYVSSWLWKSGLNHPSYNYNLAYDWFVFPLYYLGTIYNQVHSLLIHSFSKCATK